MLRTRNTLSILVYSYLMVMMLSAPLSTAAQTQLIRFDDENPLPERFIDDPDSAFDDAASLVLPGTVSCFDYYTFGSVQVKLSPSVAQTVSGAAIAFTGRVVNNNPYPIVDGSLYVKIFKSRDAGNDGNGPDVVDQFFAKGDIVIPANGSAPISFEWMVPSYAMTGEYQLATYFVSSRKFNLLGLSFTDDVVGNTVPFRVIGERTQNVQFDKASVTINDEPYFFAAFPPRLDASSPGVVSAQLENTTNTEQRAIVQWTVYQWDGLLRENVVQEESQSVNIPPNASAEVRLTVIDTRYPVYYVVGTAAWNDTRSIIGARFVRSDVNRTRINFPGVASFPLRSGEQNTLFSCLHNSNDGSLDSGGLLELEVRDRDGNLIHSHQYDGAVTSAMMGIASVFTPKQSYDYFTLTARLFQDDEFVDEAYLVFDCSAIDPALCASPEEVSAGRFMTLYSFIAVAFGIILIMGMTWVYRRMGQKPGSTIPTQ